MKNDFEWLRSKLMVREFQNWVSGKGVVPPSYQIIDRAETRLRNGRGLSKRQELFQRLIAEFKGEKQTPVSAKN